MNRRPEGFDAADWKAPGSLRWSVHNTAAFLPVAPITPAPRPRPLVEGATLALPEWDVFVAGSWVDAALVLHRGRVVLRWPDEAATRKPHMLFSVTKSVVGLVALILIEDGAVDPRRPASAYVPQLAGTAFGEATLEALLAMRDGVPFDETYADPGADIHAYSRGYWGGAPGGAVARLVALPPRSRSAGFSYRTPVADVVGLILARATEMPLARLVEDRLWHPMGAGHPAHFILDTVGLEIAGAGLNAAIDDLARLALLLLDRGERDGRQVIPARAVEALFRRGAPVDRPDRPGWSYAALWWQMGDERVAALGVHGQRMIIDRASEAVLIRTGVQPAPDNAPYDAMHEMIWSALAARLAA